MQENFETTNSASADLPLKGSAEPYLSIAEAARLAGVSASTLMRFAEAGYFRTHQREGELKFSKPEIFQVFGPALQSENTLKEETRPSSSEVQQEEPAEVQPAPQSDELSARQDQSEVTLASKIEKFIDQTQENISLEPFKQVLQLQEELLGQKNQYITELTRERDWLRTRLEKMEEKADRDQMLLMVESQKVRTLLDQSSAQGAGNKPRQIGFINRALSWLNPAAEN